MKKSIKQKSAAKPTGRRYTSVEELMQAENVNKKARKLLKKLHVAPATEYNQPTLLLLGVRADKDGRRVYINPIHFVATEVRYVISDDSTQEPYYQVTVHLINNTTVEGQALPSFIAALGLEEP